MKRAESTAAGNGANVGYEAELWRMADALRGSMDSAEYKHVALGLLFLKYVSDAFEELRAELETQQPAGADPEDPGAYRAKSIFWVPREARWAWIRDQARQPTVGQLIDLVSTIRVGDADSRSKDVLGRMYEYFLSQFASADGKKGGEFYTPRSVVTLLVEMIEPYRGRVYDPCRRPATPTSRGYSTSSATSHPAASPASCSLTDRCPPASRAKARSGRT